MSRRVRRRRNPLPPPSETSPPSRALAPSEPEITTAAFGDRRSIPFSSTPAQPSASATDDGSAVPLSHDASTDWSCLPESALARVFHFLDFRHIAKAACVCSAWNSLATSPLLWETLDLRSHVLTWESSRGLSCRFAPLVRHLLLRGSSAVTAAGLRTKHLASLYMDTCYELTDSTLGMLAARQGSCLRSLTLSDCGILSSSSLETVAVCCPLLQDFSVSSIARVEFPALSALGQHCPHLTHLSFQDCSSIDEKGLSAVKSLKYLSLAGSKLNWATGAFHLWKLPFLRGLDVSRTDIIFEAVNLLLTSRSIRVVVALGCSSVERFHSRVKYPAHPRLLLHRHADLRLGLLALTFACWDQAPEPATGAAGFWAERAAALSLGHAVEAWAASAPAARGPRSQRRAPPLRQGPAVPSQTDPPLGVLGGHGNTQGVGGLGGQGTAALVMGVLRSLLPSAQPITSLTRGGEGMAGMLAAGESQADGLRHFLQQWSRPLAPSGGAAAAEFSTFRCFVVSLVEEEDQSAGQGPETVSTDRNSHCGGPGYALAAELSDWLDGVLAQGFLVCASNEDLGDQRWEEFWTSQGLPVLLLLLQCPQALVRERAAATVGLLTVGESDDVAALDPQRPLLHRGRVAALLQSGAVRALLRMASLHGRNEEGCVTEAARALWHLSSCPQAAEQMVRDGALSVLVGLMGSSNFIVVESVAGALWNISVAQGGKASIAAAGGIHALLRFLIRACARPSLLRQEEPTGHPWQHLEARTNITAYPGEYALERVVGALANLAADDKCSGSVVSPEAIAALVHLLDNAHAGVKEQAARALANLAAHGDTTANSLAVGQQRGCLQALVLLLSSSTEAVRQEAAGAIWNLSFDDRNREAIAACGGINALVALARDSSVATGRGLLSHGTEERAAGALWGLSVTEANSIAIGELGGISPLLQMAQSPSESVKETATGALWNLAFNPWNAAKIVEGGGVVLLSHTCAHTNAPMSRFMAALSLGYIFDRTREQDMSSAATSSNFLSDLSGQRQAALDSVGRFLEDFAALGSLDSLTPSYNRMQAETGVKVKTVFSASDRRATTEDPDDDLTEIPPSGRISIGMETVALSQDAEQEEQSQGGGLVAPGTVTASASSAGQMALVSAAEPEGPPAPQVDASGPLGLECSSSSQERKNSTCRARTRGRPRTALKLEAQQPSEAAMAALAERWQIQEAGLLRCSGPEIRRLVSLLRSMEPVLRCCSAFALLQFTMPSGRNTAHHCSLLQEMGALRAIRAAASASKGLHRVKLLTRMVLHNVHCQQSRE